MVVVSAGHVGGTHGECRACGLNTWFRYFV